MQEYPPLLQRSKTAARALSQRVKKSHDLFWVKQFCQCATSNGEVELPSLLKGQLTPGVTWCTPDWDFLGRQTRDDLLA